MKIGVEGFTKRIQKIRDLELRERLVDNNDEIYNERKGFKNNDGKGNDCN